MIWLYLLRSQSIFPVAPQMNLLDFLHRIAILFYFLQLSPDKVEQVILMNNIHHIGAIYLQSMVLFLLITFVIKFGKMKKYYFGIDKIVFFSLRKDLISNLSQQEYYYPLDRVHPQQFILEQERNQLTLKKAIKFIIGRYSKVFLNR